MDIILVGLGGAAGAILRYLISLVPQKNAFPTATLVVNLLGAVLIGAICGVAAKKNLPRQYILLLKTGLCGGFTTFSTFSLEAYNLFSGGRYASAVLYVILSVAGSIGGVALGIGLA